MNVEPPVQETMFSELSKALPSLAAEDLRALAPLSGEAGLHAGEDLLQEGRVNGKLFILLNGLLHVIKNGETIAKLSREGELVGEMSLITQKPVNATIRAEIPTRVLLVDFSRIESLDLETRSSVRNVMYKVFSSILAERLASTNEKARLFEVTNRELKRTQLALEDASRKKIEDLAAHQRELQRRLAEVIARDLPGLKEDLSQLIQQIVASTPSTGEWIRKAQARMSSLERDLTPFVRGVDLQSDLVKCRILLAESDRDEAIHTKMALGGTGADVTMVASLEDAKKTLQTSEAFDMVWVDQSNLDLLPLAKMKHPGTQCIFATSDPITAHFDQIKQRPEISTILARHPQDRSFTVKNTVTTITKLQSGNIFGLEKYLGWGTQIHEAVVASSQGRRGLVQAMEDTFTSLGIRNVLIRKCSLVAEELLMNVLYDAPTSADGKPLYNHLERTTPVMLQPDQAGKFRYGFDGHLLAISVEDPFGGLSRDLIMNYLQSGFAGQKGSFHAGKGGGGMGLFQIIRSSSLTVFNVKPGMKTEVIALFNVNVQLDKISLHPSFHYFEVPGIARPLH